MDVQMPEMDGMEASRAIRKKEKDTGRHIPIVAMTAHAMPEDRQRCLEAGMDDYVSKPIQPKNLVEVIERVLDNFQKSNEADNLEAPHAGIFDKKSLLERLDGDEELLKEILRTFLEDTPVRMEEIRLALREKDAAGLELQAHSLKGAAMNISGEGLQSLSGEIEVAGKRSDLAKAGSLVGKLEKEFEKFKSAISDILVE
jgi:two-component system sensor histidine kinase/response regulator